jgi:hypothetical protein
MMKAAKIVNYLLEMVGPDYVLTICKQLERFWLSLRVYN